MKGGMRKLAYEEYVGDTADTTAHARGVRLAIFWKADSDTQGGVVDNFQEVQG